MSYFPYSTFIGIAAVTTALTIVVYCIRLKYVHRNIAPYPMQMVVVAQPNYNQLQYPQTQTCWSVPVEQPPPPYNAVVNATNANYNTIHAYNGS